MTSCMCGLHAVWVEGTRVVWEKGNFRLYKRGASIISPMPLCHTFRETFRCRQANTKLVLHQRLKSVGPSVHQRLVSMAGLNGITDRPDSLLKSRWARIRYTYLASNY